MLPRFSLYRQQAWQTRIEKGRAVSGGLLKHRCWVRDIVSKRQAP